MTHSHPTRDSRRPLQARSPGDLLALVPRLIGFHPESSLVVLTVGEADQPVHARVDLPADAAAAAALASHLVAVATRNGVTDVAVVVYTGDADAADRMLSVLRPRFLASGVEVVCQLRADGHRWWALGPGTEPDQPGTRYDLRCHPLTAQAVVDGEVVLESRRALAQSLVGDDPEEVARVARLAVEVIERLVPRGCGPEGAEALARRVELEGRWVCRRVRRFVSDGERLDSHDVARLAALVSLERGLRDAVWREISMADARRHVDLWRDVTRRVPSTFRADAASLLGFAAWLAGDGALAWCAVDRALAADPGHGLATLVARTLEEAVPPSSWVAAARDPVPPRSG
jgi:hypothetical protein